MEEIRRVLYCPHCGNTAPQKLVHVERYLEKGWSLSNGSEDEHPWSAFIAVCETCRHILVYDNAGDRWEPEEFQYAGLVYPKSGRLDSSVPDAIAKVYQEAYRIKRIAPNAYAVQIRRALEAICEDRGGDERNIRSQT